MSENTAIAHTVVNVDKHKTYLWAILCTSDSEYIGRLRRADNFVTEKITALTFNRKISHTN